MCGTCGEHLDTSGPVSDTFKIQCEKQKIHIYFIHQVTIKHLDTKTADCLVQESALFLKQGSAEFPVIFIMDYLYISTAFLKGE